LHHLNNPKVTPSTNNWAQIFVLGYEGFHPSSEFVDLVKQYEIGGVIILSHNVDNLEQLRRAISDLQSISPVPLLVMIDQEGGKVNRLTKDFPTFPSNSFFGQKEDEKGIKQAYSVTAKELKNLGINVNLAPVADVLTNPQNELLKDRSFGNDAQLVAKLTKLAVQAIRSQNIFSCAKHFPGLGNAQLDPHQELSIDRSEKTKFEQINFAPFRSAIKAGVEMIMTTHLLCEKIDPLFPATLSEIICQEILRRKLNFNGLVITDDMGMGGIIKNWEIDFACKRAFISGHDLILVAKNWGKQKEILEGFKKGIKDKEISEEKIKSSVDRILKFKKKIKHG
jgi:beta-N-acetylhexosaminidase